MCRVPFDIPLYRCRLIITKVETQETIERHFDTDTLSHINRGFGLDIRQADDIEINFEIEHNESLHEIIEQLGLPI